MADTEIRGFFRPAISFIKDIGFPIAVAVYLLASLKPQVQEISNKMDKLIIIMESKR